MTLGDRAVTPQMLASEAADHVWVEYRDGDRWTPLDPVGADRPGVAVASAAETFAQIPDSLYHHVTIRVTAEVRQGQQFETKDVLRYQTTAEALHGEQVFLWHYFDHDIAGRWRARPLLAIGDQVYGAMKISAAGLVTVAPPRNDLIAQAHQAVGKDQLGQVTDLFKADDAKPAASSAGELAAERLEVDFADPSGHVDTVRRDLLDRIGIAARVAGTAGTAPLAPVTEIGNLPAQLATTYACAFAAGPLDPASVMRSLGHDTPALDAAAALQARTSAAITHAQESALTTEVTRGLPSMLYESALTALIMSQQLAHDPAGSRRMTFYEATPRLAIAHVGVTIANDGKRIDPSLAIDLRRDGLRVAGPDSPAALVRANAARGVLDSVIEDTLLGASLSVGAISAVSLMMHAHTGRVPLLSLHDLTAIRQVRASADVQSRMMVDIQRGLAVVTTSEPERIGNTDRVGWWTVDLSSGEAIGMIDTGLHGSQVTEDAALADTVEVPAARVISPLASTLPPVPPITAQVVSVNALGLGIFIGTCVTSTLFLVAALFYFGSQ